MSFDQVGTYVEINIMRVANLFLRKLTTWQRMLVLNYIPSMVAHKPLPGEYNGGRNLIKSLYTSIYNISLNEVHVNLIIRPRQT